MNTGESSARGSVILMDVENLIIQAKRDERCELNAVSVLKSAISQADKIAAGFGPLIRADAALSSPKSGARAGDGSASQRVAPIRKDNSRLTQCLIDSDFTSVILVPQGKDHADWALYEVGILVSKDPRVRGVVLCTGDGGEPFFKLVQALLSAGKLVHVVSYDRTPQSLKNLNLPSSLLVSDIRLESVEVEVAEDDSEAAPVAPSNESSAKEDVGGVLADRAASIKRPPSFRSVIKAIKQSRADKESEIYKKLGSSMWFFIRELPKKIAEERAKRVLGRDPDLLSPKYLIDILAAEMKGKLTGDEAREIVHALCEYSDFFELVKKYKQNPSCDLLRQVRPM